MQVSQYFCVFFRSCADATPYLLSHGLEFGPTPLYSIKETLFRSQMSFKATARQFQTSKKRLAEVKESPLISICCTGVLYDDVHCFWKHENVLSQTVYQLTLWLMVIMVIINTSKLQNL